MSKIIAIYSVYNEEKLIGDSISSVIDFVDEVHIFDGAYKHFDRDSFKSTDRTIQIAYSFGKKVIIHNPIYFYENQLDKRTKTLIGKNGDIYVILDGDVIVGNPEEITKLRDVNFDVCYARAESPIYDYPYRVQLIFRHRDGMKYSSIHHCISDKNDNILFSHQHYKKGLNIIYKDIIFYNRKYLEPKSRLNRISQHKALSNKVEVYNYNNNSSASKRLEKVENAGAGCTSKIVEIIKEPNSPKYSICIPISRTWAIKRWFLHFKNVKLPYDECEIICLYDGNGQAVSSLLKKALIAICDKFNGVTYICTNNSKNGEFENVVERRKRIIRNWILFKNQVQGEYILGFEDDTLPDLDAYEKLIELQLSDKNIGFIQGNEVGRWPRGQVIANWHVLSTENGKPYKVGTGKRPTKEVIDIDGGGWYCFISPTKVFIKIVMDPECNEMPGGPDVSFVWEIKKLGYRCLADTSINCIHFTETADFTINGYPLHKAIFAKDKSGNWAKKVTKI